MSTSKPTPRAESPQQARVVGMRALLHMLQTPSWPALVILLSYASLIFLTLRLAGGDPYFFVHATERSDGIWYYDTALAPFTAWHQVPVLYYQRILYPVLATALAAGQPPFIPWSLLIINLAAIGACAYLLGWLLRAGGRSPWWALLVVGHLALFVPLYYDLSEPLSLALALAGLVLLTRDHARLAEIALLLAVLAKEITLLFGVALIAYYLLRREWRRFGEATAIVLGGYALWEGVIWVLTGKLGVLSSGVQYSWIPLLRAWQDDLGAGRAAPWPFLLQLGLPALGLGILVLCIRPAWRTLAGLLVFAHTLFVLYLPWPTTTGFIHYDRTGVGLLVSGLLLGACPIGRAPHSPTGGLPRWTGQAAYALIGLSTLGGWLLVLTHVQNP